MEYAPGSLERRFLENDPEALGQVIRWIAVALSSPRFWSLRAEWRDLHQEVLARLIESLRRGRFDSSRDFLLYVQGVARYTALQALARRPEPQAARPSMEDPADRSSSEGRLIESDLVRKVLDCASVECRDLIRAYFLEGQDYADLAAELSVPVGTVKSRLFRCLECAHESLFGRSPKGRGSAGSRRLQGVTVRSGSSGLRSRGGSGTGPGREEET